MVRVSLFNNLVGGPSLFEILLQRPNIGDPHLQDRKAKVRYKGRQEITDLYSDQVEVRGNFFIEAVNCFQEGNMVVRNGSSSAGRMVWTSGEVAMSSS